MALQSEGCRQSTAQQTTAHKRRGKCTHPRDGQGHVEILATLEPEAPRSRADKRHGVVAHGVQCSRIQAKESMPVEEDYAFNLKKIKIKGTVYHFNIFISIQ